jgi:hypothetical protein
MSFNQAILNFLRTSDKTLFDRLKGVFLFRKHKNITSNHEIYVEFFKDGSYTISAFTDHEYQRINKDKALLVQVPQIIAESDFDKFLEVFIDRLLNTMLENRNFNEF